MTLSHRFGAVQVGAEVVSVDFCRLNNGGKIFALIETLGRIHGRRC